MRSITHGTYLLPSKNTCGFPRSVGFRWSRPADLQVRLGNILLRSNKKKVHRVVERAFRKNSNANTRHKAQVSVPFYFRSSVGLTQIHDPYQVTSMGTHEQKCFLPNPNLQRYLFLINTAAFHPNWRSVRMWLRSCQSPLQSQRSRRRRSYAEPAITEIKNVQPAEDQMLKGGRGELFFMQLDLGDLSIL